MSWTRTYRPQTVSELHSDSVRNSIQNILKSNRFPQSFLFTGPKGTGKTSASRVIAHILNAPENKKAVTSLFFKKNDNNSSNILDVSPSSDEARQILAGESFMVHELDAASHRGIDDIRFLKERAYLPPQQGTIAVYILDEVHMLTTEAFNAFLKILEEPPQHVVFILATTELHKIPDTIVSRCQLISFQKATPQELVAALSVIIKKENLKFSSDSLKLIAAQADGSFRDAVKLLELSHTHKAYTVDAIQQHVLQSSTTIVADLIHAVISKNPQEVVSLLQQARKNNTQPQYLITQLYQELHNSLLVGHKVKEGTALVSTPVAEYLLKKLTTAHLAIDTPIQHLPLELALLDIINQAQQSGKKKRPKVTKSLLSQKNVGDTHYLQSLENTESVDVEIIKTNDIYLGLNLDNSSSTSQYSKINEIQLNSPAHKMSPDVIPVQSQSHSVANDAYKGDGQVLCEQWEEFVATVSKANSTYAALLRSARPISGSHGSAQIAVYYSFHHEQLNKFQHTPDSSNAIKEIAGGHVQLEFIIETAPATAELVSAEHQNSAGKQVMELLS